MPPNNHSEFIAINSVVNFVQMNWLLISLIHHITVARYTDNIYFIARYGNKVRRQVRSTGTDTEITIMFASAQNQSNQSVNMFTVWKIDRVCASVTFNRALGPNNGNPFFSLLFLSQSICFTSFDLFLSCLSQWNRPRYTSARQQLIISEYTTNCRSSHI